MEEGCQYMLVLKKNPLVGEGWQLFDSGLVLAI